MIDKTKALVFIVDDDEHILKSLKLVLARHYNVHTCNNGVQALIQIKAMSPDVIVLDVNMPDKDGFWIYEQVRTFNKKVPIIFNSAYQDKVELQEVAGAFGPFAYLRKMGDVRGFIDTIARAVKEGRS